MSLVLASVVVLILVVGVVIGIAAQYFGRWGEIRLRLKLWRWRARIRELERVLQELEDEGDSDREEVYNEIDKQYPGTLEAKIEQLEAERKYYNQRIRAIEKDRK